MLGGIANTREELVEKIKQCGESIIKNAESIVGNEKFLTNLQVTIYVNSDEPIRINVDRDFYPEKGESHVN